VATVTAEISVNPWPFFRSRGRGSQTEGKKAWDGLLGTWTAPGRAGGEVLHNQRGAKKNGGRGTPIRGGGATGELAERRLLR